MIDPARAFANRYAVGAVVVSVLLQVAPAHVAPLATLLHLVPLGFQEWGVVLTLSSVTALVGQAIKLPHRRAAGR